MQGETPDSARDVGGSIALAWAKVDQWIDGFYSILPNLVLGITFLILVAIAARIVKAAVRRFGLGFTVQTSPTCSARCCNGRLRSSAP
jgi:hypothetical protein